MQISADTVEHLKLELTERNLGFFNKNPYIFDNALVVCGNRGVVSKLEVAVHQTAVLVIHHGFFGVGSLFRLEVGTFDDAKIGFEVAEILEVFFAAAQHGLQDQSHVVKFAAQSTEQLEGFFDSGAVFHVNSHEGITFFCQGQNLFGVRQCQIWIDVESQLREFDAGIFGVRFCLERIKNT